MKKALLSVVMLSGISSLNANEITLDWSKDPAKQLQVAPTHQTPLIAPVKTAQNSELGKYNYEGSADRDVDCALVTGMGYAALMLDNTGFRYGNETPHSYRAMCDMNDKSELGMSMVLWDLDRKLKNELVKTAAKEIDKMLSELKPSPDIIGRGDLRGWQNFVDAQEQMHKSIKNRVETLRKEVCGE